MAKKANQSAIMSKCDDKGIFIVADGENIPFPEFSFDVILIVASLHHLQDLRKGLGEVKRCLKNDGIFIVGIEPNSWYYYLMRPLGKLLEKILLYFNYRSVNADRICSIAESSTTGFSKKGLKYILKDSGFELVKITPVWFLSGFFHMGAYVINRFFGFKLRYPIVFEKFIIFIDEVLLKMPILKLFPWHWNAVVKLKK